MSEVPLTGQETKLTYVPGRSGKAVISQTVAISQSSLKISCGEQFEVLGLAGVQQFVFVLQHVNPPLDCFIMRNTK